MIRGGFRGHGDRGRGGGGPHDSQKGDLQGGYHQRDHRDSMKWDNNNNRDKIRDFPRRNDNQWGSSKRFSNNNYDRQGGYNKDRPQV